jgi:hypothetical protein
VAVLALVAAACGIQEPANTEVPATEDTATASTIPSTTTVAVSTLDPGLPAAPWSVPPLPDEAVPSVLAEQWNQAANKGFCGALYPADANDLASDAVVRGADIAPGGWAVVWDRPEGPGEGEDGEYCEDCGRDAFGIAGTDAPRESLAAFPKRIEWSDGSVAGYGPGEATEAGAPYQVSIAVAGQGCTYEAWSFLGEDHLLVLIDELRFVEGMLAKVIEAPEQAVIALGPAPWLRAAVGEAAVGEPLLAEWTEEVLRPRTCPLLAPVALGAGAGATARRAENPNEMLAAWDMPNGPGRYGTGDYCANCGRGAFGIGTITRTSDAPLGFEQLAVTHTWDDGAELRVVSEATELFSITPDRADFTDPETEEPVAAPYNAYLLIPGLGCAYRLWSFLGVDHLVQTTQNLRPVIGYGDAIFAEGACPPGSPSGDFDGDGTVDALALRRTGDAAALLVCPQEGPPIETVISGAGEVLAVGDIDGDGDVEAFAGDTTVGAVAYEVITDGEGGLPQPVVNEGGPLLLTEGVMDDVGYRWGCRADGTVVQVEGSLRGGGLEWTRTAYRVNGPLATNVGVGSGTTPVDSSRLADALFEAAVTQLVGRSRCGG